MGIFTTLPRHITASGKRNLRLPGRGTRDGSGTRRVAGRRRYAGYLLARLFSMASAARAPTVRWRARTRPHRRRQRRPVGFQHVYGTSTKSGESGRRCPGNRRTSRHPQPVVARRGRPGCRWPMTTIRVEPPCDQAAAFPGLIRRPSFTRMISLSAFCSSTLRTRSEEPAPL